MKRSASGTTIDTESAELERVRAMTRPFSDLVRVSMAKDPGFGAALRQEALEAIQSGEIELGRSILLIYFGESLPTNNAADTSELTVAE